MEENKEVINSETEKPKKSTTILQIVYLVLLLAAIGALINTNINIIKYKNMLANPLGYSMDKFGLGYCNCYDFADRVVPIKGLHYNNSYDKYLPIQNYSYSPNTLNYNFTK